jgi:hypothetical protein
LEEEKEARQTALSAIEVNTVILTYRVWVLLANNKQGLKGKIGRLSFEGACFQTIKPRAKATSVC